MVLVPGRPSHVVLPSLEEILSPVLADAHEANGHKRKWSKWKLVSGTLKRVPPPDGSKVRSRRRTVWERRSRGDQSSAPRKPRSSSGLFAITDKQESWKQFFGGRRRTFLRGGEHRSRVASR